MITNNIVTKLIFGRSRNSESKSKELLNPKHYDARLLSNASACRSRNYYSYFSKSKDELENEKHQRIIKLKKRKHDASTALMASLGQKISKYGRKVLVSKGGATASRK